MQIRQIITPQDCLAYRNLRWRVLRQPQGQPPGSEYYEGEEHAVHLGAFEGENFLGGYLD